VSVAARWHLAATDTGSPLIDAFVRRRGAGEKWPWDADSPCWSPRASTRTRDCGSYWLRRR